MKFFFFFIIIFLSGSLYAQNTSFIAFLGEEKFKINRIDTVCTLHSKRYNAEYNNGMFYIEERYDSLTTKYSAKLVRLQKDSVYKIPVALLESFGRQITYDETRHKIILEGNLYKNKPIGVWYNRMNEFDYTTLYDSAGNEVNAVQYHIDTIKNILTARIIDTATFLFSKKDTVHLCVSPSYFFKSKKQFDTDTIQFWMLNELMDSIDFQYKENFKSDFVRFAWMTSASDYNISIKKYENSTFYDAITYDYNTHNCIDKDTISEIGFSFWTKVDKELEKLKFWNLTSNRQYDCYGNFLMIEARINHKYNCFIYRCISSNLADNKKIKKLYKRICKHINKT